MAKFIEVPLDVVGNILSRVPAKFLLRLRCVCKAWKGMIDDQFFVKSHTKIQQSSPSTTVLIRKNKDGALFCLSLDSLSNEEVDVSPLEQIILPGVPRLRDDLPTLSCNGLILISHYNINKSWAIWNPLLQQFHLLPPPPQTEHACLLARCGFGYDEGSDDYKVVRVDIFYGEKGNDEYYKTRVYSMKSLSWKTIDDFPGENRMRHAGAFLDGALYWGSLDVVVALDLRTEVYGLVAPPPPFTYEGLWCGRLAALDGCLIWSCESFNSVEAWVMEGDYSWKELYSVETADAYDLRNVGYLKSKGQVFFERRESNMLTCLDLKNKCWRNICISLYIQTSSLSFTQISPMSLVRLDDHHKINTSLDCRVKLKPKREMKRRGR